MISIYRTETPDDLTPTTGSGAGRWALCDNVTPSRATVRVIADDREELRMTSKERHARGLGDDVVIVAVDDDTSVGDRIWL